MKTGVGSGVGSGSAPKCHESPTLVYGWVPVPEFMIESDSGARGPRRGGPARPAAARLTQVPLTQPAQR